MPGMQETAFYSWQADCPSKYNRSFIEEAIKSALKKVNADLAVTPAPRELKFEKDTLDVPGSPPIAQRTLQSPEK